ncbi:MAG: hypothetical protein KF704_02305 [Crocinitomicaceae bacterium]|nr:hypothetical protein [Crocinitomicaceae bacterium]
MKFFFPLFFILISCGNSVENCSTTNFDGFETDSLDIEQYHFLNDDLINDLRPAITYKFKDKSTVSFAEGKDFTLLSFSIKTEDSLDLKNVLIKTGESKIQLGKCYSKCGYLGRFLKFKLDNVKKSPTPSLKIMFSALKSTVIDTNSIYLEGIGQNIGFYIDKQEFIFLPHENSSMKNRESFYMKILILQKGEICTAHIFYSENEIKTDVQSSTLTP